MNSSNTDIEMALGRAGKSMAYILDNLSPWAWSPESLLGKVLVLHRLVLHGRTHKEANMAGRCGEWICHKMNRYEFEDLDIHDASQLSQNL